MCNNAKTADLLRIAEIYACIYAIVRSFMTTN